MNKHDHVGLSALPQFTIHSVQRAGAELVGLFNRVEFVKTGRAWLYRPSGRSFEGALVSVDAGARVAIIHLPPEGLPPDIREGSSFPYFYGYYEPHDVDMILDPNRLWVRVKYEPTDSVRIVADARARPRYIEIEAGAPIRAGFRAVETIAGGWSHEHCAICQERIGSKYQPFGYRDSRDLPSGLNSQGYWLCERDYEKHAVPHDLGFLLA